MKEQKFKQLLLDYVVAKADGTDISHELIEIHTFTEERCRDEFNKIICLSHILDSIDDVVDK